MVEFVKKYIKLLAFYPEDVVVKTANGLKITTTPNHLFLVKKGKDTCEKEAKDLK